MAARCGDDPGRATRQCAASEQRQIDGGTTGPEPGAAHTARGAKLATLRRQRMQPVGQNLQVERIFSWRASTCGHQPFARTRFSPNPDHHGRDYSACPSRPQSSILHGHMTLGHPPNAAAARTSPRNRAARACVHVLTAAAAIWFFSLAGTLAGPVPEVVGLRFGASGTRTRVVVDLDRSVPYEATVQTDPSQLAIVLDGVQWHAPPGAESSRRGLVRGHSVESVAPGRAQLTVDMARPVRIVGAILLPPSQDSASYRLVVDVVADPNAKTAPAVSQVGPAVVPATLPLPTDKPQLNLRAVPVVVLDPGHGGVDPGATAINGDYEKDLVLEMAKELRTLIERSGKYRVVLTRDSDKFIRLRDRIAVARELGGNIFISLHADSLRYADQRGASIYTLSEKASDAEAARFAAQENKADILTGTDLSQHDAVVATILIDLAQRDTNNKSIVFADIMSEELAAVTSMLRRHRRFAGFAVLKSPDIPSVLLELGYLSNPDDARNLAQPNYRAKLGQAIVRSLDRYFAAPRS